ncbi:MAG TPA: ADP-polyphosphate phosphotransferase [Armatimonadota bacterium]|jgi:PPK2 family polyphosphate:nucleotide phosphotransferase
MKNNTPHHFRVREGDEVDLDKWPTGVKPLCASAEQCQQLREAHLTALTARQTLLYASNSYALLLIFQGMDAAGKDSAIKHVMSGVNPQGCQVYSFKQPSADELDHDFLWRTTRCLPERGRIGIFNRSYYEEVLVVRVHHELLAREGIPPALLDVKHLWQERYQSIRDHELHLTRNGTCVIKFFLHVSQEEQRKRLLKRIDDPQKNWKVGLTDTAERQLWAQYAKAYAACLSATSTQYAPWYVIPSDDKTNAQLIISQIILDALDKLPLRFPELDAQRREELLAMRHELAA